MIRLFVKAFGQYRWHIVLLAVLGFFASLLAGFGIGAVVPLLSFLIGDSASGGVAPGPAGYIVRLFDYLPVAYSFQSVLVLIVILFVIRAAVLYFFQYISARIRAEYKNRTSGELFEKILQSRWAFFLTQKLGFVHEVLVHDVNAGAKLLEAFAHLMLSFISAAVLLVFAFGLSPRLALFSVVAGVLILLGLRPLVQKSREVGRNLSLVTKNAAQFVMEHAVGMKVVKSLAAENRVWQRGTALFHDRESLELRKALLTSMSSAIIEPASVVFVVSAFALSYALEDFSFQAFAATIFLIQRVFVYLESGQVSLHIVNESFPRLEHLTEFAEDFLQNREAVSAGKPFNFQSKLEFKDISLSYAPGRTALSEINFSVKKGETMGITGPSGSGKTSIADLAMRLFEPTAGRIVLDGADSRDYDLEEWRTRVGYVSQDPFLLNDTVEANIRFYDDKLSSKEIEEAARKANIYDFVAGLPAGLATLVGDRGVMLSGGQRQRIALARVLARRPAILILDEATSALDRESEILVRGAIQSLRGDVTVIVIAHRLSTIQDADRLLVIDQGRIVEEGRPEELTKNKNSYFAGMQ